MMTKRRENAYSLNVSLHDEVIGVLTHYQDGKNIFMFTPEYVAFPDRKTMTLAQLINPNILQLPMVRNHKLPPFFSNLLPEGILREIISKKIKVHTDNEFPILAQLGGSLIGAIKATPIKKGMVPDWVYIRKEIKEIEVAMKDSKNGFSLPGVQMKFSGHHKDGRFNITGDSSKDDWIIKTPSTVHDNVPKNEYSAMLLARSIGIDIPDVRLISLSELDNPTIHFPVTEIFAYGIKRFDRVDTGNGVLKIHTEDFGQIFNLYPINKYDKVNYEMIGRIIMTQSVHSDKDIQEMARRLLMNILIANGDAHIKNWSMIYRDGLSPALSPAYDILNTSSYIQGEVEFALNLAKNKNWYKVNYSSFEKWAEKIGAPWNLVKDALDEAIHIARDEWPSLINQLHFTENQKRVLREHWSRLDKDFSIKVSNQSIKKSTEEVQDDDLTNTLSSLSR